jgi:anion-transporting  ArsA/GET3 family ATPase
MNTEEKEFEELLMGEGRRVKRKRKIKVIRRPPRLKRNKKGRFFITKSGKKRYINSKKSNAEIVKELLKKGSIATPKIVAEASSSIGPEEISRLKSLQDEKFKELILKNKEEGMRDVGKKLENILNMKKEINDLNKTMQDTQRQIEDTQQMIPFESNEVIDQLNQNLINVGTLLFKKQKPKKNLIPAKYMNEQEINYQ